MELILAFLGGVAVGSIVALFIEHYRTGHGIFTITAFDDSEDSDTCMISIRLPRDQALYDKKKIFLKRDFSR